MRFAAVVLAISLASSLCAAQSVQIDRVDITGFGILTNAGRTPVGTGSGGIPENRTSGDHIVTTTDVIPACIGMQFGIQFRTVGKPDGAEANLVLVTRFPELGLAKPGVGMPILVNRYGMSFRIGGLGYSSYSFDNPWEMVPGVWTLEIWSGDRQLASHSFTVVRQSKGQANHACRTSPIA